MSNLLLRKREITVDTIEAKAVQSCSTTFSKATRKRKIDTFNSTTTCQGLA